ncbi:hypothetical protein BCR42DRAFT_397417 [Absidia repens]|uniref:F-box domain-containing protein n=1 Tax=Absidia repens TaxID=90262 RepID=A0A1X2I191_9FUNG|nr:hypothetical protein BCR42DRAFT_397417 [Absidia repens]
MHSEDYSKQEIRRNGGSRTFFHSVSEIRPLVGRHIRKLELITDFWIDTTLFLRLMDRVSLFHVEEFVTYKMPRIRDISLQHLARHCPNLKTLSLNFIRVISS